MIRPHTTGHFTEPAKPQVASAEPTVQETADVIGRSLLALVIVVEGQPPVGPAVKAYQAAIRRNGEEAAEAGGREAMEAALRFVMDCQSAYKRDPGSAPNRDPPVAFEHALRERPMLRSWSGERSSVGLASSLTPIR